MNYRYVFNFDWYDIDTILLGLYKQLDYAKSYLFKAESEYDRDTWLDEVDHIRYLIDTFNEAKSANFSKKGK